MNREYGSRGYTVATGTSEVVANFYGFSVTTEAVITAVSPPTKANLDAPEGYLGDEAGLAGITLPVGFYPIRGSSLTLASGEAILWHE